MSHDEIRSVKKNFVAIGQAILFLDGYEEL